MSIISKFLHGLIIFTYFIVSEAFIIPIYKLYPNAPNKSLGVLGLTQERLIVKVWIRIKRAVSIAK